MAFFVKIGLYLGRNWGIFSLFPGNRHSSATGIGKFFVDTGGGGGIVLGASGYFEGVFGQKKIGLLLVEFALWLGFFVHFWGVCWQ